MGLNDLARDSTRDSTRVSTTRDVGCGVEVQLHLWLNSALAGGQLPASRSGQLLTRTALHFLLPGKEVRATAKERNIVYPCL